MNVPLFLSGKPMHSKYRPLAEAQVFADSVKAESGNTFFIVTGLGAGYHICALRKKFPDSFILCIEADKESLDFCLNLEEVEVLKEDKKIEFTILPNLFDSITALYLPQLYTHISILLYRSWQEENPGVYEQIQKSFNLAVKAVSADYSVQCHFAKQWQRNIMLNLLQLKSNQLMTIDTKKIAAIIGAGPSLDKNIETLKKNRDLFFIIATDTSLGSLVKQGVNPDIVLCIDAQRVSLTHFFPLSLVKDIEKTTFAFDILSNSDGPSYIKKMGGNVFFVSSNHPLAVLAAKDRAFKNIPILESGGGTVTVAACDLARILSFKKIQVFGADFAYSRGKAYAKGTYLDTNLYLQSNRLNTREYLFDALMFRAPLSKCPSQSIFSGYLNNPSTSEVLQTYQEGLLTWAKKYKYNIKNNLLINEEIEGITAFDENKYEFNLKNFYKILNTNLNQNITEKKFPLTEYEYALLPYIAYLQKNEGKKVKDSFFDLLKLAYSQIRRYNTLYEK